jgi:hypothetical protein
VDATTPRRLARLTGIALVALCAAWFSVSAAPSQPPELESLIARIGHRVAEYYRRAQSVMCVEHSTVQPVQSNWTPEGFARTVESDLRIEAEMADGESSFKPTVFRDIRRINGRAPRERDKTDRAGCTDPTPWSTEPLAFLLPAHRDEYRFTSVGEGKEQDRAALIIEFMSTNRTSRPELIEDERGHDDCFDWSGPVATRGRVWVDAITHDVLRVDRRIDGPIDLRVPWNLQRRYNFPQWIVLERDDVSLRYQTVAFSDPDEVVLLPASIESLTVLRSSLQSVRRTDRFSNYRRFLTASRVVKAP